MKFEIEIYAQMRSERRSSYETSESVNMLEKFHDLAI